MTMPDHRVDFADWATDNRQLRPLERGRAADKDAPGADHDQASVTRLSKSRGYRPTNAVDSDEGIRLGDT